MSPNAFQATIAEAIGFSALTQTEIARSLGYPHPNIITQFKRGTTRVPPNKVVPLAAVLRLEACAMLRLWFSSYEPELVDDLDWHWAPP